MLETQREAIVAEALQELTRRRQPHYEASGPEVSERRLRTLFDLAVESVRSRSLVGIVRHSEQVARERFEEGFDFREVHAAFNALEEAIWKHAFSDIPPEGLAESIGLAATVLGAGKEALAAEYSALASQRKARSLDLSRLFEGPGRI